VLLEHIFLLTMG